jgi:hypothetical protein
MAFMSDFKINLLDMIIKFGPGSRPYEEAKIAYRKQKLAEWIKAGRVLEGPPPEREGYPRSIVTSTEQLDLETISEERWEQLVKEVEGSKHNE